MENIELLLYGIYGIMGVIWWSLNAKIDKIESKFDPLSNDLKDLNTRLSRIEGILLSKECCMINDDKHKKKAE